MTKFILIISESHSQILAVLIAALLVSCTANDEKEDQVSQVDKKGSIETELSVQHIDSADVLITKHKIWKDNTLLREIIKRDTIPSLGDSSAVVENEQGYMQQTNIRKDYQFFITVQ